MTAEITSVATATSSGLQGRRVLVMGASGYVGTHLVPFLAGQGATVRAAARRIEALRARGWRGIETLHADTSDDSSLAVALAGIDIAYYLVHSMAAGRGFPRLDREAAERFAQAAARAGVQRIVYLGGLQPKGRTSAHLASRSETGEVLRQGPVPVTELRAGIIIGPGSAAFEVIRDLVNHLPVMITPRWVTSRSQPIALADVLEYLARVATMPEAAGAVFDIGGPEVLTYEQLMRQFAEIVGRRPVIVPVPVLTPTLSSYWLDLVTSVPANVARALIEGLEHDVLANDLAIRTLVPRRLLGYREAAQAALAEERRPNASSRWTEGSMRYRQERADFAFYAKQISSQAVSRAPADTLWTTVASIGGEQGYYFLSRLWSVRGCIDRLVGGVGMREGRRHPSELSVNDVIDFWRVAAIEPGRRLTLLAEMKLPGAAALDFEVTPLDAGRSRLRVTAYFHPAGAPGLVYWHALAPVHAVLFTGMVHAMAADAARSSRVLGVPAGG